ncbi:MAG: enhanced serine sensitivity protein SseB C-terminal domain-containing protein, partial [Reyranella sp.]
MQLSRPDQPPEALIDALAQGLGALGAVKAAWLVQARRKGQAEPSWLLGVDHRGSWSPVDAAITSAIDGVDLAGRALEATSLTLNPLARDLRAGIPVVAQRRGFLDFLKG